MAKNPLSEQLIDLFARDETDLLRQTLLQALSSHRSKTLDSLESLLDNTEGKLRMTLLEVLVKDGGADLIPFFIQCIRSEKNVLYAKSQILLFKEFRHQRALGALLSIEEEIDTELKSTFQRTLGRLLSQFSEQYYMSEFQAGVGDPRRVQFAADMMLRSPHPDFLPFLAERVLENDLGYREEGLRVLKVQGDLDSNDTLFAMLARLRRQTSSLQAFIEALTFPREDLKAYFQNLIAHTSLNWDDQTINFYFNAIAKGEVEDALGQILDAYQLSGDVRKKLKPYLKGILCGGEPSNFQTTRAKGALEEHLKAMTDLQVQSVSAMGEIAQRGNDPDFLTRLENVLPEDDQRDALIIASLSGYRNESSVALLSEYVNTCSEPEILEQALSALTEYDVEEVPKGIEKLCFDEGNGLLRRQAVDLMARWGHGDRISEELMDADSLAVCADGVRIVAEYNLDSGYARLLNMLKRDIPDSLVITILEALVAFPRATTGRSIKPFLISPHTLSVRKAALYACFRAGGEDRMEFIVRALSQAPPGKNAELLDSFLNLVLAETWDDRDVFLMRERDFWLSQLNEEQLELWPKILQLIESLPLGNNIQARGWLHGLKKVVSHFGPGEPGPDHRRILGLVDHLEEDVRRLGEFERESKMLHHMLEALKTTNPYQRTQAMRNLVRNYPANLISTNASAIAQIMAIVLEEFARKEPAKDTLIQAIHLAGKLRHPKLYGKLKKLMEYPNIDVRGAAKSAYEAGLDRQFTSPVRSIFIMDDSRYITKQLSKVLAREGYEADFENDVEAGLERLAARRFDLLILDVIMPRKSGAEFLREARRRGCAPEFTLVITSSRSREELNPVMTVGVDGLLLKPFRMEEMLGRIDELLPGIPNPKKIMP